MKKTIFLLLCITLFCPLFITNSVSYAQLNAFDIITDSHISFYEEYIANETIVSNKSAKELEKLAKTHNATVDNIKRILILQHALNSIGKQYTVKQLSNKNNSEIIALIKDYYDHMNKKLTNQEKSQLKEDFKKHKKRSA